MDLFPSSGEDGEKTPTQLGPLERANLNHWTPLWDLHNYLIIWDQAIEWKKLNVSQGLDKCMM
jgi:hypothetical protein